MYKHKTLAVVIPAYNEEKLIGETLRSIPDYVDRIFLVDDCSADGTLEAARRFISPRITLLRHERNLGVGAAIVTGYKSALDAGCDLAAVMAGDGQMDAKYLPSLLDPLVEGKADYAKGNRLLSPKVREGMPKLRLIGNSILTFLTKVSSGYWDIIDPQNGYAATTRQVLETLPLDDLYPRYGYPNDLLVKLNAYGFRVMDVVMAPKYGSEKSKIRLWAYMPTVSLLLLRGFFWRLKEKYVLQAFHPLVFFYLMGLGLLPLGIISGFYMLYLRIHTGGITAASVLIPTFLVITGMQSMFFAMLFDMQATKK